MKTNDFNVQERIDSKLFESGIHFLTGDIEQSNIDAVIKWITYENLDLRTKKTLTLYINSAGGDLYNAFALINIMRGSHHTIRTIGIGSVMSAAFLILASGTKGERYVARDTGIMCHQYSDETAGKHHDLKAQMREGDLCHDRMLLILRQATNLPNTKIRAKLLTATDSYLTAEEIKELNVVDHII